MTSDVVIDDLVADYILGVDFVVARLDVALPKSCGGVLYVPENQFDTFRPLATSRRMTMKVFPHGLQHIALAVPDRGKLVVHKWGR